MENISDGRVEVSPRVSIIDGEVVRASRPCKHCDTIMVNPSPQKLYCSEECGDHWWRDENKRLRHVEVEKENRSTQCKQCGKEIEDPRPNKVYCDILCGKKWHSNQKKLQRALLGEETRQRREETRQHRNEEKRRNEARMSSIESTSLEDNRSYG